MARDQALITCTLGTWTELTNADVTGNVTFQPRMINGCEILVRTLAAGAPADTDKGLVYDRFTGVQNEPIANLALAITPVRIWAKPVGYPGEVFIDHA